MQNKGVVKMFTALLALICLYQLSFTFVTWINERKAREVSHGDMARESSYLDSLNVQKVYNLGFKNYTYRECKEKEIALGLDLKGGMNVILEVSVVDIIKALSNYSQDTTFLRAINLTQQMQKSSQSDFLTLFNEAFTKIDPNARMAAIFNTLELKDKINFNSTNEDVMKVLRAQTELAIDNSFKILRTRIDKFGVVAPEIQKMGTTGRLSVQLPGVKDPKRVRKLLQGTANLEFWETYENKDVYPFFLEANKVIKSINDAKLALNDSIKKTSVSTGKKNKTAVEKPDTTKGLALLKSLQKDTSKQDTSAITSQMANEYPLFSALRPNVSRDNQLIPGSMVGWSIPHDTSKVNAYLNLKQVRALLPRDIKFLWSVKPSKYSKTVDIFELYAIKVSSRDGRAPLTGDVVNSARADFDQNHAASEVSMSMNGEGTKIWARMTKDNIGKCIAIVLDNAIYSAPRVNSEIPNGNSQITGDFTTEESKDLANVLESGKLPAPAHIIQETVVGPTLGKESIQKGLMSFIVAFIGVLIYMLIYYNRAGTVANVALFANVVFLFGCITSFGTVLTLPGFAGMVLTLAMAVDGNVIIYERMREEVRAGKGMRMVVKDGFYHAYSSIIDGHVTTILTGVVLFLFGTGPVQGFAVTLVIGLVLSLFSSIFIARLMFEWMLDREMNITLGNRFTINTFKNININFIGIRKPMYVFSSIIIGIGIISLFVRGLDPSVEFAGGRTFVVRFDQPVTTSAIRASLTKTFSDAPEVKTFGPSNQVKITTKYLIEDKSTKTDSVVEMALYQGVKGYFVTPVNYNDFTSSSETKPVGKLSSQKVDPTFSADLIRKSFMAVFFGLLIIFIYIAIRFKNWKYGLGGVVSLFHDTMVTITMFTLFYKVLPFSLEIDQQFIAALLTIIGYSIMDTVIIFDRIREYNHLYPKRDLAQNINGAINSTLGRTINTSGITLVVLIVIFIFGGEILRGFIFALIVGVTIGTYSSVFNATPVAYDFIMMGKRRAERKKAKAELNR